MGPVYGSRARVGIIDLSTCTSLIPECGLAVPGDVACLFSRLRLPGGEVSARALEAMLGSDRLEEAAQELADAEVAAIAFACTTGSLLHGPGFDAVLRERIERRTGVRATTTATAMVDALRAAGARSVSVGTPYPPELDERERVFLEAAGFEVAHIEGLGLGTDLEIGRLNREEVLALGRRVGAVESDAVFLSCTNLPALPLLDELEGELGRPVVTSNAATIWQTLCLAGAPPRVPGLGALLGGRLGAAAPA